MGGDRPATLLEPEDWNGTDPLPLLVALHGYGNSGSQITRWVGLDNAPDALVLLPNGLEDSRNYRFWNATPDCCDFEDHGVDDVGYLLDLVAEVQTDWPVESAQISLIGHSNGGFMNYTLVCEAEHPFAAMVSIAGAGAWDETLCEATRPVSVLQVHGTNDRAQAIEGDPTGPGADEMVQRWGERGGCAPDLSPVEVRDYAPLQPGDETQVEAAQGCVDGIDIELWRMVGANHSPRFTASFQTDVRSWMLSHRRVDP